MYIIGTIFFGIYYKVMNFFKPFSRYHFVEILHLDNIFIHCNLTELDFFFNVCRNFCSFTCREIEIGFLHKWTDIKGFELYDIWNSSKNVFWIFLNDCFYPCDLGNMEFEFGTVIDCRIIFDSRANDLLINELTL